MDMPALRFGAALIAIFMAGIVISLTKWLVASEKAYPRQKFPVTGSDRSRGVLLGFVVAVAWGICDAALNRLWHRSTWDPAAWGYRTAMFVLIVLAARLSLVEIFRVIRCKTNNSAAGD